MWLAAHFPNRAHREIQESRRVNLLAQPMSRRPNIMFSFKVTKPPFPCFDVQQEVICSEWSLPKRVVGQERRGRGCLEARLSTSRRFQGWLQVWDYVYEDL